MFHSPFPVTCGAYAVLLILALCGCIEARAQATDIHILKVKTPADLRNFFRYTGKDIPLVSGHRGGMIRGYPENSLAAFENTLRHTPAFFEVDPRLTKDSVVVLMHDATLERTTNGKGKVSDYTWEELKKLKLKDPEGNLTSYGIPTLEQAILWSRGKTVLNLDKKDVPLEMIARIIRQHRAESHVLVTVHNAGQARFYLEDNPHLMFSAHIRTREALEEYEKAGIPWSQVMAYIGPKTGPEARELLDLLHARGVMCMIGAGPSYDRLPEAAAREQAYRDVIRWGADVIESDLPIEVARAIGPLVPRRSKKKRYFGP